MRMLLAVVAILFLGTSGAKAAVLFPGGGNLGTINPGQTANAFGVMGQTDPIDTTGANLIIAGINNLLNLNIPSLNNPLTLSDSSDTLNFTAGGPNVQVSIVDRLNGPGPLNDVAFGSLGLSAGNLVTPASNYGDLAVWANAAGAQTLTFNTSTPANSFTFYVAEVTVTPLPAALVLMLSALSGLFGFRWYSRRTA